MTGNDISGAVFKIQEYSKTSGTYQDSLTISYNTAKKKFVSQTLYYTPDNQGKFKVIETAAPNGYRVAAAQEITIGANTTTISLNFDEPPITGAVEIEKERYADE